MADNLKEKNRTNWFIGIIAFLLFALVLETGLLLQHFFRKSGRDHRAVFDQDMPYAGPSTPPASSRALRSPLPRGAWHRPFADDAFDTLRRMQESMNRMMNSALTYGPPLAQSLSQDSFFDFAPAIDLKETDQAYVVTSDLPGLDKDKINITVQNNLLTIQGVRENLSETKDQQGGYYAQERSYGSFARTVTLPGPVDDTKIDAQYKDGVLTVTLPKTGDAKNMRKISVQ